MFAVVPFWCTHIISDSPVLSGAIAGEQRLSGDPASDGEMMEVKLACVKLGLKARSQTRDTYSTMRQRCPDSLL